MDPRLPSELAAPTHVAPAWLLFARNFVRYPRMLGSVVPSSRFLVRAVLDRVDWDATRTVVEYGPGVGTFTREILARLPADGRLLAIDTNSDFIRYLGAAIPDRRLAVAAGSAADVGALLDRLGLPAADCAISGIPFSTMPPRVREAVLSTTWAALRPGGQFLVYQFSGAVQPHLERVFGEVEQGYAPLNVLPARWFACRKRDQGR